MHHRSRVSPPAYLGDHVVVPVLPGTGEFRVVVRDVAETELHGVSSAVLANATLAANGKWAKEVCMDFGIGIATSHDSWKLAQRAEELGFTHAWFFDTQMITADCFVAMGAAALKTSRVRLGTGVLVPSNRIAAVTANAFATLNGMAPGRIDFGVGTGFSARRAMGLGAMKLADMEEYIRVVYGLLNGETLETNVEGKQKKIRFLNPDFGLINTRDPIKLHVSAYGPKSQALTARLNAGWKTFISDVPGAMATLEGMRQSWMDAGRAAG